MGNNYYLKKFINNKSQILKYGIFGGFIALIDFSIYKLLIQYFDVKYIISNILSINFGILTSYVLNMRFTFKLNDYFSKRFFKFYSVGLLGLFISTTFLYIFINILKIDKIISKIIIIGIVAIVQFIINKFYTFKNNTK
jgi:putative flippase GtrA